MPVIWGEMLPASGLTAVPAPDLEVYQHDFQPNRKGAHIDLHIPVEP
jgi:AraC family transcriptional regulator